jgi:hypothetical protein
MRGFVLILVVDESQAASDTASLVRVAREYDVETAEQLVPEVQVAAEQAINQLRLGCAWLRVRDRDQAPA